MSIAINNRINLNNTNVNNGQDPLSINVKKNNKKTKVPILLATYNGEKFLQEQLDSIINQKYKLWEILIHDDGSFDNTIKILEYYTKNYPKKIGLLIDQKIFSSASKNFFHLIENLWKQFQQKPALFPGDIFPIFDRQFF